MTFRKTFSGEMSEAEATRLIGKIASAVDGGSWALYDLRFFGAETEEDYEAKVVSDCREHEALLFTSNELRTSISEGRLGFDWSSLYFFELDITELRRHLTQSRNLPCAIAVFCIDSAVWHFASRRDSVARLLREEPQLKERESGSEIAWLYEIDCALSDRPMS